ncbi:hypothetical protein PMV_370 [Port-miou virus]|uniref:Uncharacterized protein n=1 Tax=Port-miou virus TaxID=1733873 RepID=A0A0N9PWM5_9VIRU|nr:hypothetical protein PMV_370 [Port-miou virus]
MSSQTHLVDDSLEELFQEIRTKRERDMQTRIQNYYEDKSYIYITSDPRTRKTEIGTSERQDFLVLSPLPKSLEVQNSTVHKRDASFCIEKRKGELRQTVERERVAHEDSDSMFVELPEETHLKFATENFLRMMKNKQVNKTFGGTKGYK